ncbi:MAG: hypothetical protein K9K67_05205 [Bacteriovoracaceae bacterium]|nr:hypothetical protein [Bacteriovoracaceae bacterium]
MSSELRQHIEETTEVFIQQVKEWGEIITDFETSNKYELQDANGQKIGFLAEVGSGIFHFIKKQILRSHRSMKIKIWDTTGNLYLTLERPFFWFFSDLFVIDETGNRLGQIRRRFAILHKKYDLVDNRGHVFGRVNAPIWNLWTFPILDKVDKQVGVVSKKWGGILKEVFTDADKFGVSLPDWDYEKKAISLACAVSIDLDFFEDNQRN